jgi:cobalamin-dependent methionine synthase I
MPLSDLIIIAERINPGFKSVRAMLEAEDIAGIQALAVKQTEAGATYLDVNVGRRANADPEFMAEIVRAVQAVVDVPLCFDSPNPVAQEASLKAYDPDKAGGQKPLINSIAETRWDMLELIKIRPFKAILMASERMEDGAGKPNRSCEEVVGTAHRMIATALERDAGLALDDLFIDVSVSALSSDTDGMTKVAIDAIKAIGTDPKLKGIHLVGGLTNISGQLPAEAVDGSPLKPQIENAFLTLTLPYGFDTIIGTPWKEYAILPDDNFVLRGFKEIIALSGLDALRRVRKLYTA